MLKENPINTNLIKLKTRRAGLLLTAFALSGCMPTENPNGSLEAANLEKALYCMEILENRPDLKPSQRIEMLRDGRFSESYIQHSPHVEDGREAVLKLFASRYERAPELSSSVKRTASQGDLVWIHQHVKRTPEDRGNAVVNIFRMENGKFAEHWNVIQSVPEESRNDNTMF